MMSVSFSQRDVANFGSAVASYLDKHKDKLDGYSWGMSNGCVDAARKLELLSIDQVQGGFKETLQLREAVAQRVLSIKDDDSNRMEKLVILADFVIRDWGALSSNKPETIKKYVDRLTGAAISLNQISSYQDLLDVVEPASRRNLFDFSGIASWSKWISFVWGDWALIYDARIAFALNAIHFMSRVDAAVLPEPTGRNALLTQFNAQSLAAFGLISLKNKNSKQADVAIAEVEELKKLLKSTTVRKNETYAYYLEVMTYAHNQLWAKATTTPPLLYTEMLLFMISVEDVAKDFTNEMLVRLT